MSKHLFLTGPIGCGKSTAIAQALQGKTTPCGGFFTRRHLQPHLHFTLQAPDGSFERSFLDFSSGKPEICFDAFQKQFLEGDILILDEIGGIELLEPDFRQALLTTLDRDIPILGVVKGPTAASALIRALELTKEYGAALADLYRRLDRHENTQLYHCGQFDPTASGLTAKWAEEYLHG